MRNDGQDRRQRRSSDPLVALHYQLTSTRSRGELDAIVVADPSGVVVAGAGSWPVCEELAAYAPLLADGAWVDVSANVGSRIDDLRRDVEVRALSIAGQDILLCARRHKRTGAREVADAVERDIAATAAGVTRILAA